MMKIKIVEIKVDKTDPTKRRARKWLGNVPVLAESIHKHGLLHPIIVDELAGDDKFKWRLIAGERRLTACIINGSSEIEAKLLSNIDDMSAKEIELEENIAREELSWLEKCEAFRQLDELKKRKYGTAQPGSSNGWGMADTAESIGMSESMVAEDIKLARDLRENPELVNRVKRLPKTAAKKIVKQEIKAAKLKRQVERNEVSIASNLMLGDACELIDNLEDESVHMLLTDPPFAVGKIVSVGSMGSMTYNKISKTNVSTEGTMRNVYKILIPKIYKKLVPGAHIYIFLGMYWYPELTNMLRDAGFEIDDSPLIWHKRRPSMIAKDIHYTSSYEAALFGYKPPNVRVLRKPVPNVFDISAIAGQKRIHPLQKPFELLKIFVENSSSVGEIVLDCFAGSASTLIAAQKLQRSGIGFEIDSGNYLRAQEFMRNES